MKFFFDIGDRYLQKSTWKDLALVKFCLFAMGVIVGMQIPKKEKKTVTCAACGVFLATYVPLMVKLFRIMRENDGNLRDDR